MYLQQSLTHITPSFCSSACVCDHCHNIDLRCHGRAVQVRQLLPRLVPGGGSVQCPRRLDVARRRFLSAARYALCAGIPLFYVLFRSSLIYFVLFKICFDLFRSFFVLLRSFSFTFDMFSLFLKSISFWFFLSTISLFFCLFYFYSILFYYVPVCVMSFLFVLFCLLEV